MPTDFDALNAQALRESYLWLAASKVKDFLWTEEYFRQFAIVVADAQEVDAEIDRVLAGLASGPTGKFGCGLVITPMLGGRPIPNNPAAFSEGARLNFEVVEVPELNRNTTNGGSGQPAAVVAEMLAAVLQNFACGESGWENIRFYAGQNYLPLAVKAKDGPTAIIHPLEFLSNGGLNNTTARVLTPEITQGGMNISGMGSATAGSATYYTVNGANPLLFSAGNANNVGTLYSGQVFAVEQGEVVRARAFKDGLRASLLATHTVP